MLLYTNQLRDEVSYNLDDYDSLEERRWMFKQHRFLLISTTSNDPWSKVFAEAANSLGSLQTANEKEALKLASLQAYDIFVIDSAKVVNESRLITSLRVRRPYTKIVVVTVSPTWRRAREAFRAGATDYIRKSINRDEIYATLQATIAKIPPSFPR